ncbi:type III secretion system stator protein SctL [Yersinia pseudotuberculosis]|uniref:type III secretion system stator protein SctL n=1 Tax=Yersinia pseudotuberculosis TaxID=633 RepID=UPI0038B4F10A
MNPFHLEIEKYGYPLPPGVVIPAAYLAEAMHSQDLLAQANAQAAEILQAAEQARVLLLDQAAAQADALISQAREQMETALLAQHVRWLVGAEQLESLLITQVRHRILAAITSVVTTWSGEQPMSQILIQRLGDQAEKMAQQGELTLRVHPQHLPAVTTALGERLRCVGDTKMAADQAQLSSPMLQLTLSLHHHLSQLVLWLQQSPDLFDEENVYE